jgi:signal transduction histidine kinase
LTTSELEKENDQLKYILFNVPGYVYWKDRRQTYLGCNQEMLNLHQLMYPNEFIGKTLYDFLSKEMADAHWMQDEEIMKRGSEKVIYERGVDREGNGAAYYITRKKPLFNENGDVVGLMGVSINITDRKKAEELEKKNEIAQEIIQKLKTIAGSLSHEIRTPLAGLRTGLSLTKSFFDRAIEDITQLTVEAAKQQRQWIYRMIDRLDSGTALINMQLKNMTTERICQDSFYQDALAKWIEQAVNSFPYENQTLTEKVHADIDNDFAVVGDPLLTKHMLWNLLNNAFYFIKEEDRGEIFITTEELDEHYLLRFKDTAKGMPADEATRVFDQFYTKRKGGSGLGLHFCQLVMEAYGGRIKCRAEEGQYTEFLLFFPKEFVLESESTLPETEECAS